MKLRRGAGEANLRAHGFVYSLASPPGEVCWLRNLDGYTESHSVTLVLAVALSIRHEGLCTARSTQSQNHLGGSCQQENA